MYSLQVTAVSASIPTTANVTRIPKKTKTKKGNYNIFDPFIFKVVSKKEQQHVLPKWWLTTLCEDKKGCTLVMRVDTCLGANVVVVKGIFWVGAPSCGRWDTSLKSTLGAAFTWLLLCGSSLQITSEVLVPVTFTPAGLQLQWKPKKVTAINTKRHCWVYIFLNKAELDILFPFVTGQINRSAEISILTSFTFWQGKIRNDFFLKTLLDINWNIVIYLCTSII